MPAPTDSRREPTVADEYTPTTEQVRETYAALCKTDAADVEFDRWIAAHDRATAARAWDEAVRSMRYEDGTPVELVTNINPYREETP